MSQPDQVESQTTTEDSQGVASQTEEGSEEAQESSEPKTYDEKYVKELRDEAASKRVRFDKAAKLAMEQALHIHAAKLQDTSDLLIHSPLTDLVDGDGLPDAAKISEATTSLLRSKPHLAKAVYTSDIGQGGRPEPEVTETRSMAEWMQSAWTR